MPLFFSGPEGRKQLQTVGWASTVGLMLVMCTLIGYGGGYWLDQKLDTAPWLERVGIVLGIAAGIKNFVWVVRKVKKEMDDNE